MTKTLNDNQRKLVEDNHNLIYSFLNSRHLSLDSVEDWYGTAAIGLCKAAMVYDESIGSKFTTLAYICMDNEVRQIMRKNKKSIIPSVSLDDAVSGADGCYLSDIIPDEHDIMESIYINDALNIAYKKLNERDRLIIDMIVNQGLTHDAIAKKFRVSQPTVSRIYCKFLKTIKEYFND
mgnify:CR=1 FL=1